MLCDSGPATDIGVLMGKCLVPRYDTVPSYTDGNDYSGTPFLPHRVLMPRCSSTAYWQSSNLPLPSFGPTSACASSLKSSLLPLPAAFEKPLPLRPLRWGGSNDTCAPPLAPAAFSCVHMWKVGLVSPVVQLLAWFCTQWIIAYNLGLVYLTEGRYVSAFHYFHAAVNLKPDFAVSCM